jgi:hypothetical protein
MIWAVDQRSDDQDQLQQGVVTVGNSAPIFWVRIYYMIVCLQENKKPGLQIESILALSLN